MSIYSWISGSDVKAKHSDQTYMYVSNTRELCSRQENMNMFYVYDRYKSVAYKYTMRSWKLASSDALPQRYGKMSARVFWKENMGMRIFNSDISCNNLLSRNDARLYQYEYLTII